MNGKLVGCLGMVAGGVLLVVVIGFVWLFGTYSALNSANQTADAAWGNVESSLQRRADLIPRLVNTVKGYANHEKAVFTAVTEARSRVGQVDLSKVQTDPEAMQKLSRAQGELSGALSRLLVVAENYPQLKADQSFLNLQAQLEGTENRINIARERYNEALQPYNVKVNGLLSGVIARTFGFQPKAYFKADASAATAPKVQF
jgi:LemA protein